MVLSLCMPRNLLVNMNTDPWVPPSRVPDSVVLGQDLRICISSKRADPAPWEPCIEKHCHGGLYSVISISLVRALGHREAKPSFPLYFEHSFFKKKPKIPSYHKIIMEFSNAGFLIFYYGFSFYNCFVNLRALSSVQCETGNQFYSFFHMNNLMLSIS